MNRTDYHEAKQSNPASSQRRTQSRSVSTVLLFILLMYLALAGGCVSISDTSIVEATSAEGALAALQVPSDPPAQSSIYPMVTVLPTYSVEMYQTAHVDPAYNWPYAGFDRERYILEEPQPVNRAYRLIVLENEHLRLLLLPDLGGRIWQVIHKPTGNAMFYQNSVVKPSPWGPANQTGWTGLGGMEWNLPVIEHGYDWGTPWDVQTFHDVDGTAVARISTPNDGRYLAATIEVRLPPDAAHFELIPQIQNISDVPLDFDYWHNAMLAPGTGNHPSPELRFLLPGEAIRIHSTGDVRLPGPDSVVPWPHYRTRDLSRLGEWDQYLGFFEFPAAHGPYAGVYEPAADTGVVRVYPANVAPGSKVFGLGWNDALASEYYTDDDTAYVELHGGLAPTFSDRAHLDAGESVSWRERWYPVHGIGQFRAASEAGALSWNLDESTISYAFYPSEAFAGHIAVKSPNGHVVARQNLEAAAGLPETGRLTLAAAANLDQVPAPDMTILLEDDAGAVVLSSTAGSP